MRRVLFERERVWRVREKRVGEVSRVARRRRCRRDSAKMECVRSESWGGGSVASAAMMVVVSSMVYGIVCIEESWNLEDQFVYLVL